MAPVIETGGLKFLFIFNGLLRLAAEGPSSETSNLMSKKSGNKKGSDQVITPGGPRSRNLVHEVEPGTAVMGTDEGTQLVRLRKSSAAAAAIATSKGLVATPGGFRHPSLVHRVEPGHALHAADGKMRLMNIASKAMKDFRKPEMSALEYPALGSGWIVYAYWNNGTGKSITSFKTRWVVPAAPADDDAQLIYLFNGIQNYGYNYGILQPVLQWGASPAGGGSYWAVASWYVTSLGAAFYTPAVKVNEGDTLTGVMTLTGKSGNLFNYTSAFEGIAGTSLPVMNIAELLWCNETLEAYSIADCSDYPNTLYTAFTGITIQTGDTQPTLDWTAVDTVTDCGQFAAVVSNASTNGRVDLHYRKNKSRFDDTEYLVVKDPILLWLYRHGWEDPGWGRRETREALAASSIYELAEQIEDRGLRAEIRKAAGKALAKVAEKMTEGS